MPLRFASLPTLADGGSFVQKSVHPWLTSSPVLLAGAVLNNPARDPDLRSQCWEVRFPLLTSVPSAPFLLLKGALFALTVHDFASLHRLSPQVLDTARRDLITEEVDRDIQEGNVRCAFLNTPP